MNFNGNCLPAERSSFRHKKPTRHSSYVRSGRSPPRWLHDWIRSLRENSKRFSLGQRLLKQRESQSEFVRCVSDTGRFLKLLQESIKRVSRNYPLHQVETKLSFQEKLVDMSFDCAGEHSQVDKSQCSQFKNNSRVKKNTPKTSSCY